MIHGSLLNRRVLVVEDEALIALDLEALLTDAGMVVAGPVTTLEEAVEAAGRLDLDMAVLDVSLKGELIWPAADELMRRNIPIVFLSGYDAAIVPDRFRFCMRLSKPINSERLLHGLAQLLRQ